MKGKFFVQILSAYFTLGHAVVMTMKANETRRFGRGTRLPNGNDSPPKTTDVKLGELTLNDSPTHSNSLSPTSSANINLNDKPVKLQCNYVPLTFENKMVYMYAVTFMPEVNSTTMKHRIVSQLSDMLPEVKVFDGNVLYTIDKLDDKPFVLTSALPNQPSQQVKCSFTFSKEIKAHESHALVNIIFRKVLRTMNLKLIGRNYYNIDLSVPLPKHKLHIWPGFVTSIKNYEGGTFLNIDVTHRFLRMQTIYEQMAALYMSSEGKGNFSEICIKTIVGQTVITRYNNKSYRIDDIDFTMSPKDTFMWNGKPTSYIEYYKDMYGKTIMDCDQPLLIHRAKEKLKFKRSMFEAKKSLDSNATSEEERIVCLIPELCYMTGLDDNTRLNYSVMKELSSYIHSNPSERFKSVHKFLETLHTSPESMAELNKWGITIAMNSLNVDGRYFPNEKLICQEGKLQFSVDPATGWISKLSRAHLLSAVKIDDWVCVFTSRDKSNVTKFLNCVVVSGNQLGMMITMPRMKEIPNDRIETYISSIRSEINSRTSLVMIVTPTQREDRYAAIKRMLCCDLPHASQVIQTKTISNPKKLNSVAQRVAMQINCKLGGELWAVRIPLKNVMAIGIDVYHSVGGRNLSTVAFVSSLSSSLTKWFTSTSTNNPGEIVTTIKSFFAKALEKYVENNGTQPTHIIVFRDGVGLGQHDAVRTFEVKAFTDSLDAMYNSSVKPVLVFLLIVKRNNTRIYDMDETNDRKLSNPRPGTVVDNTLTFRSTECCPTFYLISQHFNQGTITPTCYRVLFNNSSLAMKQIQLFTYKCTYLYYNWPGTVSVPAPCQYAHKAAYLTGQSLMKQAHNVLADKLYYL